MTKPSKLSLTKPLLLCRLGTRRITSTVPLPDGSSGTSHTSRKAGCLTPPNRLCRFLLAAAACRCFQMEHLLPYFVLFSIDHLHTIVTVHMVEYEMTECPFVFWNNVNSIDRAQ